jgi:hypothetical protein
MIQAALNDLTLPNNLKNRLNRWLVNFNNMMATWDVTPPPDAPAEYQPEEGVKTIEISHPQMNLNELRNQLLDVRSHNPNNFNHQHCHAIWKHIRFGQFLEL